MVIASAGDRASSETSTVSSNKWVLAAVEAALTVTVNGTPLDLVVPPRRTLADALRDSGLTGTHLGCEHGVCGACTVLVDGMPMRACLMFAIQAVGKDVETVEGLAEAGRLNRLQAAFDEAGAQQCGFCTPGFLMLATGLLRAEPDASPERVNEVLASNLCRCTGYAPIRAAVLAAQATQDGEAL